MLQEPDDESQLLGGGFAGTVCGGSCAFAVVIFTDSAGCEDATFDGEVDIHLVSRSMPGLFQFLGDAKLFSEALVICEVAGTVDGIAIPSLPYPFGQGVCGDGLAGEFGGDCLLG